MLTCADCRDLIWDELYGLLEASESQTLRRHVTGCADCQAEMTKAEAAERLIASVARLDLDIPPFSLPAPETAPAPVAEDRPSLPAARRFRLRPWMAAAAALLVCVGLSYGLYRHGFSRWALALEQAHKRIEDIAARQEELVKKSKTELEAFQVAERGRHTRLQVLGPATYQPGLLSQYRILATDLNDRPRPVELTARLSDAGKGVLFETKVAGQGELSVTLPDNLRALPRTGAGLEFTAVDAGEPLHLRETISVLEPHYVTQLATDKAIYHPGETIYFRSLTLEPFALTPTDKQFNVSYTLMDPGSARIARVAGLLWPCCAGGGTFALKPDALPGEYRLTITDLANRFWPVTRTITVVPREAKDQPAPEGTPGQWTRFGLRFQFFPEGGSLVAGAPNRVYFRAQDGKGAPVDVAGEILDSKGNGLVRVETVRTKDAAIRGLGVFSYTPVAGESYTLRVAEATAVATAALPAARAEGIVLCVPASVVNEGEEIALVLHGPAGKRNLIVAATCRGSLVAESPIVTTSGATELTLKPARGTRGVLRLTVFDSRNGELQAIAERFIYCVPAVRLDLVLETDKKIYRPGDPVTLTIKSSDEKRRPELAWLSVSTGKRDTLGQADGLPGLPPHLEFDSGLAEPKQIEQAIFMVRDNPQEKSALDLFLGTHGWPVSPPSAAPALAGAAANPMKADRESATVAMFALDNLGQVEKTYLDKVHEEAAKADQTLAAQIGSLGKKRALLDVEDATRQLADYQKDMQVYGRMALGGIAVAALTLACLFLIAALVGMARGSARARRRLATAFVTGIICPLCLPLSSWIATDKIQPRVPPGFADNPKPLGQEIVQDLREQKSFKVEKRGTLFAAIPRGPNPPRERPPAVAAGLPLQEFEFHLTQQPAGAKVWPDTLLWVPGLIFNGQTQLSFDLPKEPAVYGVRVEGHTPWGQLGIAELLIDTRP